MGINSAFKGLKSPWILEDFGTPRKGPRVSPETSVINYQHSLHINPEVRSSRLLRDDILKSRTEQ